MIAMGLCFVTYLNEIDIVIYVRTPQGLYSLSGKTSYRKISWSIEAVRLDVIMSVSSSNVTGISAALLNMNLAASILHQILQYDVHPLRQ